MEVKIATGQRAEWVEDLPVYYSAESPRVVMDAVVKKAADRAALEMSDKLEDLMKENNEVLKTFQDSVKEVDVIEKELEINTQTAKDALATVEQEYIKIVKETVKRFENEIDNIKEERKKELETTKENLMSIIEYIVKTNEDAAQMSLSVDKIEIISSLSTNLTVLSQSEADTVDKTLGYVKFEPAIPSIRIGQLSKKGVLQKPWELIGQFSTGDFNELLGLALDEDDNIAVCSWEKGVKVFTRDGDVLSTLYYSPGSISVGVLPGERYVSAPLGKKQLKICDSHGKKANTSTITNVNGVPSLVNAVTVDIDNKILVGQVANTISIYNTDGSPVSKFATQSEPYRLAVTSKGEIVSSFFDTELERGTSVQLMDYSGSNIRAIQPPNGVKIWSPGFVCCRRGEIFVSNEGSGDPNGVYRYTSDGDYLGCVTTEVMNPTGIASSMDGTKLFVADRGNRHIKIFRRP